METSRFGMAAAVGLSLLAGASLPVFAADAHKDHQHSGQESGATATDKAHCEHCQQAAKTLDDVIAKLGKAKQSNDIGEVKAILSDVEKPLAELKEHTATCSMKTGKAEAMCSMCNVALDKDGRCPKCGMKM
jgi:hypothetical protein